MIIKLTNVEARKIIQAHFSDLLKASGQRIVDVTASYNNFEIECSDETEEAPKAAPGSNDV